MGGADLLTPLQIEVAAVFFGLTASDGYVLAGGAGLLASDLIARRTEDIDLFASAPVASVTAARQALVSALLGRDREVKLIREAPTFARLVELAGRKLLALFGRAEARDFADVYVLVERFGKVALFEQARALDAGFDLKILGQMVKSLSRFDDDEIPLAESEIAPAKAFFAAWGRELS